jgi:hypothetical protein
VRWASGLWTAAILLAPTLVQAQARLDASACEGIDAAAISSGLEIELADAAEALRDGRTVITLACGEEVRIEVGDPITDKHVVRVVPMPELDRERVLTLAIAQLVLTSWLELLLAPQEGPAAEAAETVAREAVAAAEPTPPPAPPPLSSTSPTRFELALDLGPHVRLEGESLVAAAAAVRAQLVVSSLVIVGARLGAEWSRAFRERGTIDLWGGSLAVRAGLRTPPVESFYVDGAIELGVGLLSLEGHPVDPGAVSGGTTLAVVADGFVEIAPSLRTGELVIGLPLSIGGIVLAPDAIVSGERSVVTGGAIFSAALRLAWAPR